MEAEIKTLNPQQWVHSYSDKLYAFALSRLWDEEKAKDLVQETFLAALEGINGYKGKSSELTWLTAILKNKIIDVYRKNSRNIHTKLEETPPDKDFFEENGHWKYGSHPMHIRDNGQSFLENKELAGILKKCILKLPALWLSVFTMKHMEDFSSEAICSTLDVSPSNFWVIIHRCKLNLRACIQKNSA
ncbi:MAG: sigma-70 family RNA polymerase sigma factor [Chitinophagaceae bacterium]|nr:sigma-70 family RNA polymerase sigma factor [Chitinophagaceae bacterium]